MKSSKPSISVRFSLKKLGMDIKTARLRRKLPAALVAERAGISLSTFSKIEKGDVNVSIGNYAAVLFGLGLGTPLGQLVDPSQDTVGLALDLERLPKRARTRRISAKEESHE